MTSSPPLSLDAEDALPPPRELSEDELAGNVLLALHRLTKGATLYASDNQAAIRQLDASRKAIVEYGQRTQLNPKIFFTEKSVFVGGRLLRAGRTVYQSALELGGILRQYGIDEVSIAHDVGVEDLKTFQAAVRDCIQGEGESPAKAKYERIRLRRGQAPGRRQEEIAPEELVVRTYATATIVMRRFLTSVQAGDYRMPIGVRRVAQQLAELSAAESPAFLGTTAVYNAKHEHAGRAVNAALVAMAMARQLIDDKRTLARIAMAALMFDIGIPRVAGTDTGDLRAGAILPPIIDEQYEELPTSAAATMWAVGGFGDAAVLNTVLVYEALSVAFSNRAPAPYQGLREPTMAARIVAVSRRFNDMLSDPQRPRTADQALCELQRNSRDDADRTLVRILASALGLFTTGSLVHLSTGEVAKVVETSDNPLLFSLPVVRPVMGADGETGGGLLDLAREDEEVRITALVELGDEAADEHHERYEEDAFDEDDEDEDDDFDEDDEDEAYGEAELPELDEAPDSDDALDVGLDLSLDRGDDELGDDELTDDEINGVGARESWSDLEIADEDSGEWMPNSSPPVAPGHLPPEEDFAPAPASRPGGRALGSRSGRVAAAPRRVDDHVVAVRKSKKPASSPSAARRVPAPRTPAPRTPAPRTPPPRSDTGAKAASDSNPENIDAALMAYLSEMEKEKAPESKPPSHNPIRVRAKKPADAPREVLPPLTPPPLTPLPRTPVPMTPPPATPAPLTPISLTGRDLAELKPTATGSLDKTPLVHLLVYTLDRRLTGTTAIVEPDGNVHLIYFVGGVASKVRTAGLVHPLDKVLRDLSAVPLRTLKRSVLEVEQSGELHGQHLIERGEIDNRTLLAALQWQLLRKITHMLSLSTECRYAFYNNVNALSDYGGRELTPVDPMSLIMSGLRLMGSSPLVSQALARLGGQPIRLRKNANLDRLRMHPDELAVVSVIQKETITLTDLVANHAGAERTTLLTVYALMITRSLDIGSSQKPPVAHDIEPIEERWLSISAASDPRASAPPRTAPFGTLRSGQPAPPPSTPAPATPAPVTPAPEASRAPETSPPSTPAPVSARTRRRQKLELDGPPSGKLGNKADPTPRSASPARASAASAAPARASSASAPSSRGGRVAAHSKKKPAATKSGSPKVISDVSPSSAKPPDPYRLFKKAQLKLMTGKLDEAEDLVQQAVDAAPEEPEYVATLAWIQAEILGPPDDLLEGESNDHYEAQIALIDQALTMDERYAKALFYRAELWRLSGHRDKALDDYRRVVEIDPHNEEAASRVEELG